MVTVEVKTWCSTGKHGSSTFGGEYPDVPTAMDTIKAEIEIGLQAAFDIPELRPCTDFSIIITGGINEL